MGLGMDCCYFSAPDHVMSDDEYECVRSSVAELRELAPYHSSILIEFHKRHGLVHCKLRVGYPSGDFTAYAFDETALQASSRCFRELKESLQFWKKSRRFEESLHTVENSEPDLIAA